MRRYIKCIIAPLLSLLCCGCAPLTYTIKIGADIELTGRLAWYGKVCQSGMQLAVSEINAGGGINGKPLELVVMDNRSENSEAALAAVRLASRRGVRAIIGPTTSGGVKAVLSAECGVPLIVPSATADDLAPKGKQNTMIRLCFTDSAQANFLARFAIAQGYKKAALLTEASSDYSRGMSASFTKDFTSLGGTVTAEEYYRSGECDFYSVLSRLAQKDFDALFLPGYYSEAALIIRQLHELGINAAILSGDAFDVPELCALVGEKDYLNDIYFTDHYTPQESEASAFSQKYYSAYGEYPPAYAALGYDSVMVFCDAAKRAKSLSPDDMLQALAATKGYRGVTGTITIDENHNCDKEIKLMRIQNGVRGAADSSGG